MESCICSQLYHHILVFAYVAFAIFCTIASAQTVLRRHLTDTTAITVASSQYPNSYPNNENFAWQISAPSGYRIMATLGSLSLERNKDFLRFGDGEGRELIRLTGKYSPPNILSPANVMWMNFTSDASSTDEGFTYDVSLFNQSEVRLVGGTSPFNGRVEVLSELYGWGTVSSFEWNLKDAATVCRELGLPGAFSAVSDAFYGEGSGTVFMTGVDCSNDLFRLQDCFFRSPCTTCPHSQDAGANCHRPNYLGCYALPNLQSGSSTARSIDDCISKCDQANMRYAALNGDRCYCRTDMTLPEVAEDNDLCDQACSDNPNEACGGTSDTLLFTVYDTQFATCEDPGIPENATRSGNSFQFGSKVKYNCSEHFDLIGDWELTCVAGSSLQEPVWDTITPHCLARVENTTQPMNTTMLPQEQPQNNILTIVAIVLASVFAFLFLILLIVCICRCHKRGKCRRKPPKTEMWY